MNTRFVLLAAALLPMSVLAGEPQAAPSVKAADAVDEAILRGLVLEASRKIPQASPRTADVAPVSQKDALIAASLKSAPARARAAERTDCDLLTCRVHDEHGRYLYAYDTPSSTTVAGVNKKAVETCLARKDDMLTTFERQNSCNGIGNHLPSPFDPPPFARP